ncbi:MAG: precorrin-6y C5,15-methyltransferase (decarboxylating) subunit CbiE [Clostridium sp.]|uniref:precorrin-6y C5,15-methyltransferase (decarboxylating) subunit CbiE n=1 Tax=Clostridium TaxID=1485 RepID=UPI0021523B4D|nr:precorrin-6y C5,15-methyltransferase (decarboxylating) subunit CbiE [Clostridium sp. LY3-2]MCR6515516.1 precorrin-6y C5,15-methyltransferase (decarboxylating) subunit CbiE [Clostridium sp. LY3-2]
MIYLIGIGPGNKDYMLKKAIDTLKKCDVILGFERAIKSIEFIDKEKIIIEKLTSIESIILENKNKDIGIIASGDPNFYGISNYLNLKVKENLIIIPGITSFQYLMSKINKSWSKAYSGSMHGREEEFIKLVKENEVSIWLCDKENTPDKLCLKLLQNNIKCRVYVGENLSYEDERIISGSLEEIINNRFSSLSILVIER